MKKPLSFWKHKAVWMWLFILLLSAVTIARTTFTADMSAFMPRSPSKQQQLLVDQITVGSVSRMVLMGLQGGTPEQRQQASIALAQQLRDSQLFTIVTNGESSAFAKDREFLMQNRYLLSPQVTAEHFSETGLRTAITESVQMLASPAGLMLKSIFPQDPTGELMTLVGDLANSERPMDSGVWVSKDGQRAILMAQTKAAGSDTDAQEQAIAAIHNAYSQVQASHAESQAVQLLVSGAPVFSVDARETIRAEASRLSIMGFVLVIALLLFIYRSPRVVGVSLLPVLTGVAVGISTVSLCFGVVHGVTIGFGTTLIGEAIDYSIYYFVQSGQAPINPQDQRSWIDRYWPTIRLGVLTSVVGFAALVFAGFPGIAQLGLFSIAGLTSAALVTRYVLPAVPNSAHALHTAQHLGHRLLHVVYALQKGRLGVWLMALVATCYLLLPHTHSQLWDRTLAGLSPVPQSAQDLDESLRKDLGQPDLRYLVVVHAPNQEALLQATEKVSATLKPLVEAGDIAGFETPTKFLPSKATQEARQAAIPDTATLQSRLQGAMHNLPVEANTFAPFIHDVEAAKHSPYIGMESLQGTAIALTLEAMLVEQPQQWTALLPLRAPLDAQGHPQLVNAQVVKQAIAQAQLDAQPETEALYIDIHSETTSLYERYFNEAIYLSLAGFVAIIVLLFAALKNAQLLARTLLPIVLAEAVIVAGLSLLGVQLTLLHLIGLLLVVAVGSNYSLFFVNYATDTDATDVHSTLSSLLIANTATVLGFGVLAFSSVPVLNALGRTVAPGAFLALLFAAALSQSSRQAVKQARK